MPPSQLRRPQGLLLKLRKPCLGIDVEVVVPQELRAALRARHGQLRIRYCCLPCGQKSCITPYVQRCEHTLKEAAAEDMARLENTSSVAHDALTCTPCKSHDTTKPTKEVDAETCMEDAPRHPGAGRGGLGSRSCGRGRPAQLWACRSGSAARPAGKCRYLHPQNIPCHRFVIHITTNGKLTVKSTEITCELDTDRS